MNFDKRTMTDDATPYLIEDGSERKSRRRWIIIGVAVAVVVAALIAFFALGGGAKDAEKAPTAAAKGDDSGAMPSISVMVPGQQTVARVISGTGSIAARRELPVGVAGEGGLVTRVLVDAGTWVAAGQVLATVDRSVQSQTAESLAAQIRVARADAQLAQAELDRALQLVDRGFISKADIDRRTATRDSAVARVRVAEAQLDEARARNGRLDIRAPAAGLILSRAVEPGQIVSGGSGVLFRMAQGGQMEMQVRLSEADLTRITTGVPADVTPVGSERSYRGEVWQVSPVIDPQTRQGIVRVALSYDQALRPGGFATARIQSGASVAPRLPQSAVQSDGKGNFVYIVDGSGTVVRRDIRTGAVSDDGVLIASGLDGTERVVVSAGAFLNPGQKVNAQLVNAQDGKAK
ncbi:efflux RND transporter periplasmic adaptor subunit [Sphingomonas sp. BGYR3]|uniref:efflux RND transporter periplasmic adaptor subunit n=1 Tax=Sphingomonas sp. BGYR3 TaxID=2975483 RepID=UPI0021A7A9BE|nr:efflux RND transporter periplasmic adaptor subunit [Sphingomonas sp. BGYR3]MDG5488902.1 efflux RND transporter periplasmic adaptor subunit [Sphingomonas sp. BGYR3]